MRAIVATLLRAIPAGLAALALHGTFGLVHWYTWGAYVVIGLSIALFGRGGELLRSGMTGWNAGATWSVAGVFSGVPFWFFSGGCGYATGMLIAKKFFLIGFYDTPVRPIFLLGGIAGCVLHMIYESTKFRTIFGGAYDSR